MLLRGVRGAITVNTNNEAEICANTMELLQEIVAKNAINTEDIGAVIFSSTPDIPAAFPAIGARKMGWSEVPLFGTQEIDNPNGVPLCIRVLILWNTELPQNKIRHIYLRDAVVLRQDIAK